ncbi:hypothetical protein PXK33_11190, partial [Phaeobacter gallaeciensis]|nr:hypothetical protein [Phaeobacter gallaeciensis]
MRRLAEFSPLSRIRGAVDPACVRHEKSRSLFGLRLVVLWSGPCVLFQFDEEVLCIDLAAGLDVHGLD